MVSIEKLISSLLDEPYKFILMIAAIILISTFQYTIQNANVIRPKTELIIFYCLCAWIYHDHIYDTAQADLEDGYFDSDSVKRNYKNSVKWTNIAVVVLTTLTAVL